MSTLDVTDRPRTDDQPAEEDFPFGLDERPPERPRARWHLPESVNWPEAIINAVIVLFICGFVIKYLQPSKLFLDSTPAGGDMGAHVWQPWFLRHHLLTHFRLTGWAPDWYAGFPSLVFYFPLPSLLIVLVTPVMGYNVAFKLVSVLGLVSLPLAAYVFGRLARFRFPGPACLAAATLPFLFSTNFTIYGGNIASTLAGEFGFSISLSAALVFLGLVARGLETGKYRALASVVLLVTGLCHLLPAIFAIVGAIVLVVMRWDRRSLRWVTPVFAVAAGLAAFWWMPFLTRLPYATDMGYEKITQYYKNLFPPNHELWTGVFILAGLGFLVSLLRRQKLGIFLAVMATLAALIFRFEPQGRLWNARVLPFWFLCLYLLAAVGIAEGAALLFEPLKAGVVPAWSRRATLAVPMVAAAAVWVWVGFPLHGLPFGSTSPQTGKYTWMGISTSANSFIPSWAKWNYSGYESDSKSRRAEYFGVLNTMAQVGKNNGCGRAMWEYEPGLDQMGTPDAFMLLPYWTHSCIGSMEGLYYESAATTPYHFLNAAELSLQPSDPVRGLKYSPSPNVAEGVRHLQLLGVRYYMALTSETQTQADTNPDLRLVATSGPWPVSYSTGPSAGVKQRTWKIYEVANSQVVTPLINQPVVMTGTAGGQKWLDASQAWYLNKNLADVLYAASGPNSWPRVAPTSVEPPRNSLPPVQVDNIVTGDDSVSFTTDTIGVPVLVKVSYFPNWQASGAKGPYRVAPNLMVVIPTSHHVRLHYGYTPVDWLGYLFGILGLAALVWLFRAKPVVYARVPRGLASTPEPGSVAGLDDAYTRLQRELAAGAPVPVGGAMPSNDELDAWLGFPAGLGGPPPPAGGGGSAPGGPDHAGSPAPPYGSMPGGPDAGGSPAPRAGAGEPPGAPDGGGRLPPGPAPEASPASAAPAGAGRTAPALPAEEGADGDVAWLGSATTGPASHGDVPRTSGVGPAGDDGAGRGGTPAAG